LNPKIFKVIALIVILSINFQNNVFGNDSKNIEDFSRKLQELRDLNITLLRQISNLKIIMVYKQKLVENLGLPYLLTKITEINALSHVYIFQLNEFDPLLEIRRTTGEKALEIPEKSLNYCCWKNISLIHMWITYRIQETQNDETIKNINALSPNILHSVKDTLDKLQSCLKYFDTYFAYTIR
jgi:hypothetical protein